MGDGDVSAMVMTHVREIGKTLAEGTGTPVRISVFSGRGRGGYCVRHRDAQQPS